MMDFWSEETLNCLKKNLKIGFAGNGRVAVYFFPMRSV